MLETSKDLLLIVIAFCLIWLTAFVCWAIFYVVMILRDVSGLISGFRRKLQALDGLLQTFKEKLENSALSLGLLVEGVSKIVKYFQQKADKKQKKKKVQSS